MSVINGKIPAGNLTSTSIGVRLRSDAAASIERIAPKFKKALGRDLRATDGYRSYESQERIFLQRYRTQYSTINGKVDARRWNGKTYYRYRGAAAAVPGTSNHGLGLAVDFAAGINTSFTSKEHQWFVKNGPKHGWTNTEGKSVNEPWHWVYDPKKDTFAGGTTTNVGGVNVAKIATVKKGSTGLNVKRAQGLLTANARKVDIDGVFGAKTEAAVKKFQTAKKLVSDGVIGTKTWSKLLGV